MARRDGAASLVRGLDPPESAALGGIDFLLMSAEEPETEAGAANDATEVVGDDFTTRLRKAPGGQADAQPGQAWSEEDEDADDAEQRESHPWSVVTSHAAALLSVGAAVAAVIAVLGWITLHKDRPAPSPATGQSTSSSAAPAPPPPTPQPTPASIFTDEQDQRLLNQLTAQDYTITDAAEVVQHAQRYCTLVQQGIPADKARQSVASEALSAKPVGDQIGIESRRFYPNEVARTDDAWLDISRYAINAYYPHCGKLADLNSPASDTPTALPAPSTVPSSVVPPAPLSARDQQFLAVLQNMGLGYPSPDYAISHAHATCDYMAKHPHSDAAADNYVAATTVWAGLDAVKFADYSAVNYCPQYASE